MLAPMIGSIIEATDARGVSCNGGTLCTPASRKWVLAATILGSSMAFIDSTVTNVALPVLQKNLGATVADVQWVIEAYSLFLSALLLVGGSLGDQYGRRRIFLAGIGLFAGASMWCGLAHNIRELIIARAVQGIGAALLVPGSLAIISSSFPQDERGRAIGTWSGFSAITAAIGPVLGGWLIDQFSWRAVFFINVPIAIGVITISLHHVPESRGTHQRRVDWPGAVLIAAALGALVFGLIESPRLGFASSLVMASLLVACVCFVGFIVVERRSQQPMVPFELFRSRTFTGANLLTLFLYAGLTGTFFFLPLNLIQVQGYAPTAAGAALLPMILIMFLLSRWSGGLVHRYGGRLPLQIGPLIAAVGFALLMLPGIGGSYWRTFFPALVVLGAGMAITVAPLTTVVMNSVVQVRAGIASGINNAVSRTAGLLAIAVLGIVVQAGFNHSLGIRLAKLNLDAPTMNLVWLERGKLAGIDLSGMQLETRRRAREAIDRSFLDGFRRVMLLDSMLALVSAATATVAIRKGADA